MKLVGREVVIHCTNSACEFHDELPLVVVDEVIYENPPTILLATVDKFARLQFKPEAGRLLGLGTSYRQPSLIIQDELHLLSGPLGTTVAVFDAVIQILLSLGGAVAEDRRVDSNDPRVGRADARAVRTRGRAVPAVGPRRRPDLLLHARRDRRRAACTSD